MSTVYYLLISSRLMLIVISYLFAFLISPHSFKSLGHFMLVRLIGECNIYNHIWENIPKITLKTFKGRQSSMQVLSPSSILIIYENFQSLLINLNKSQANEILLNQIWIQNGFQI